MLTKCFRNSLRAIASPKLLLRLPEMAAYGFLPEPQRRTGFGGRMTK